VIPPTATTGHASPPASLPSAAPVTVAKVSGDVHASKTPSPSAAPKSRLARQTASAPTAAAGTDPLWDHNARTWLTDMVLLLLLGFAAALITWWRLIKMGPVKRR
jgi:hypothetical protein